MIDLRKSRRNKIYECKYWKKIKDVNVAKFSELSYRPNSDGFFDANIVGKFTEESQVIENAYMFKKITTVIETVDDVRDLEENDIVEMEGKFYRVKSVDREPTQRQKRYLKDEYISYTTYISLTR